MSPSNALLSEKKHTRYKAPCVGAVVALLAVVCLSAPAVLGQSDNWNGGTGNWSNGALWGIGVPAPTNDVMIYSGGNDLVTLDVGSTTINSLTLGGASNGTTSELTDNGVAQTLTIFNALTVGQTGVMNLSGGSTVTAGADSSNAGQIELSNGSSLSITGAFTNTGSVVVGGGVCCGNDTLTVLGDFTNAGELLMGHSTVSVSGTLVNSSSVGVGTEGVLSAGVIVNSGSLELDTVAQVSAGSINNSGSIGEVIFSSLSTQGDFNNNVGGVWDLGSGSAGNVGGNFNNHGSLDIEGGSAPFGVGVEVTGAFNNYSDGTVEVDAESIGRLEVGGQFTNAGAVTLAGHGTLNADGGFLNNGTLAVTQHGGLTTNWFTNAGNVFIQGNGVGFGTSFTVTGTFNNTGTVDLAGSTPPSCGGCGGDTLSAAWFNNSGSVTIAGTETVNVSNTYNQTGGSTTIQPNGALAAGMFTQSDGIVQVDGSLTATGVSLSGGLLAGRGTINGNVLMAGTILPGAPGGPGVFTINGNYTQTGTGIFNELISNSANGLLTVGGAATLGSGSTLMITLLGGFNPAIGTSFTILDYGSESGTFKIADPTFNNGTERWVITSYDGGDGDDIVLTAEKNMTPTPELPTLPLLTTGIAMAAIFMKYRNAAR